MSAGPGWIDEFTHQRLLEGNRRFRKGRAERPHDDPDHRVAVATAQHPFAMVVCCSDSREVPEIIFDCGLGDLFVVRSAGHVVGDTALASIEFAVVNLGVRFIVVLGHTGCGAINATLEHLDTLGQAPGHLPRLLAAIAPAATGGQTARSSTHPTTQRPDALAVTRIHVARTCAVITEDLAQLDGALVQQVAVHGAVYDLSTGAVSFTTG